MKNVLKKALVSAADYFIPSHCFACSRAVAKGAVICDSCYKEIEKPKNDVCDKCGINKKECDCKRYVYHFSGVAAPFINSGIAQKGVYGIKFNHDETTVEFYAHHMAERLKSRPINSEFSCVTFVPMGFIKKLKRGYNQAELLAKAVAKILNIPFKKKLIYRSVFSSTQHNSKSIVERFENAYSSYHRYKKAKIPGGRVLLVDDIKTTGASLEACARELLYAGADEVFCLTALISSKNS